MKFEEVLDLKARIQADMAAGREEWLKLKPQIADALEELANLYGYSRGLETRGTVQFEKLAPLLGRCRETFVNLASADSDYYNDKYGNVDILGRLEKETLAHAFIALRQQEVVVANDTLPIRDRARAALKALNTCTGIRRLKLDECASPALQTKMVKVKEQIDDLCRSDTEFGFLCSSGVDSLRLPLILRKFFNQGKGLPLEVRAEQMLVASESADLPIADKYELAGAADQMAGAALDNGIRGIYAKDVDHDAIHIQKVRIADEAREALKVNGVALAAAFWRGVSEERNPMEVRRMAVEWFDDIAKRAGLNDADIQAACNGGIYGGGQNNWREVMKVRRELLDFALKDFTARTGYKPREWAPAP